MSSIREGKAWAAFHACGIVDVKSSRTLSAIGSANSTYFSILEKSSSAGFVAKSIIFMEKKSGETGETISG